MVGDGDANRPVSVLLTSFVNLLADGQAPTHMQAYIGGARGTALRKSLKSELDGLRQHLLPHQFAVGVPAGAEVLPHLARQWRQVHSQDPLRVLLAFNERNAHNEVDRHTFLTRMREVAPGLSRWLEYIYPTDVGTKVFYRGRVIESRAEGQQGCPPMPACHAVVQRLLHEALGLAEPMPGSAVTVPALQPAAQLDLAPDFADDGFLAGSAPEVLRSLRHLQRVMPGLGLHFSSALPVALRNIMSTGRLLWLQDARCRRLGNFEILKSPVGEADFCRNFCDGVAIRQGAVVDSIGQLPDPHVAFYLLRSSGNSSRMLYLARTTPKEMCGAAFQQFDAAVRSAFVQTTGLELSDASWRQAALRAGSGGLGLRASDDVADPAYLASRASIHRQAALVWSGYYWDAASPASFLEAAASRCNVLWAAAGMPDRISASDPDADLSQRRLSCLVDKARLQSWLQQASADDICRLHALQAPHAAQLLQVVPSPTLDTHLTGHEFVTSVATRLGVDVVDGNLACGFCAMPLDTKGRHALSCMAGGDAVAVHHTLRDLLYDYCDVGATARVACA